jgi:hypothetical protein
LRKAHLKAVDGIDISSVETCKHGFLQIVALSLSAPRRFRDHEAVPKAAV